MEKLKIWFSSRPLGAYCAALGIVGAAVTGVAFVAVWGTAWGKDLFAPGAVLMTVALTAYIASRGVVSWQEQKKRDRESKEFERREKVYSEIATFMLQRFIATDRTPEEVKADRKTDAELRTHAALWASSGTVHMLAYWQSLLSDVDGSALTPMQSELLKQSFGRALVAMREDLAPNPDDHELPRNVILKSIFND
ncbi:hypothetical protein FQP90_13675 [Paenarthrobacter nitroguajacolicus]|uniref:DUF4760 domain-containing protein n=1 Tax=Paenarthrobacter nitroguajacolicus TaxID=211146 RepID=A0A558GXI1_PAENT|nr:hypothetical protein [Paenarthrobacter nitroguajacolicus]TVU61585.1 hypothetical protein FQP90_13675 [Paenarthrobacter nitroguajacolicus]